MNNILAIVVTYYPEKELIEKNISAFINNVDKILIWENTPELEKLKYRYIEHKKVVYCGDGVNSISHALNYAWKYAKENGFNYLLTMDQDSILENFDYLIKYAENHLYENIIIGPSYNKTNYEINERNPVSKTEALITSGSLIYIGTIDEIGGYDDKLVIDGIDTDFCLKANRKGIYSYRVENCNLIQRFGKPEYKRFLGKKILLSSYSAKRLESILKAHVYLIRKHKNMSKEMRKYIIRHYIKDKVRDIVLFEDNKCMKIAYMIKGIVKGLLTKI